MDQPAGNPFSTLNIIAGAPEVRTQVHMAYVQYLAPLFTGMQENTITATVLQTAISLRCIESMHEGNPTIRFRIDGETIVLPCRVQAQEHPIILGMIALLRLDFRIALGFAGITDQSRLSMPPQENYGRPSPQITLRNYSRYRRAPNRMRTMNAYPEGEADTVIGEASPRLVPTPPPDYDTVQATEENTGSCQKNQTPTTEL